MSTPSTPNDLQRKLDAFDRYRKRQYARVRRARRLRRLLKILFIPFLLVMGLTALLPFILPVTGPIVLIGAILGIIRLFVDGREDTLQDSLSQRFKAEVVAHAIQQYNPEWHYNGEGKLPRYHVDDAGIFDHEISSYQGEDYVKGTLNGKAFEFSELNIYKRVVTAGKVLSETFFGSEDENTDYTTPIPMFKGLMFSLDLELPTIPSLIVVSNRTNRYWLFKDKVLSGRKLLPVGDREFQQRFSVYASDPDFVASVLTKDVMDQLLAFEHDPNTRVLAAFVFGRLLLGIDWDRNLFECDYKVGMPTTEDFEVLLREVALVEKLATALAAQVPTQ